MSLLAGTPPLITLLATSAPLWRRVEGKGASLITDVDDAEVGQPSGASGSTSRRKSDPNRAVLVPHHSRPGALADTVTHLQSPHVGSTYIELGTSIAKRRAKGSSRRRPLGATHGWFGIQLRPLGERPVALEIGLVDAKGREGAVRMSSWITEPTLHATRTPPLAHLPLALPREAHRLTEWAELVIALQPLLALFRTLPQRRDRDDDSDDDEDHDDRRKDKRRRTASSAHDSSANLPDGRLAYVSYIRIYANCRVRRVWLAEDNRTDGFDLHAEYDE